MMRIVGLTNYKAVFIQKRENRTEWKQYKLNYVEFENLMKNEHPVLYKKYLNSGFDDIGQYFWNYGETEEMKRKGVAYIFN